MVWLFFVQLRLSITQFMCNVEDNVSLLCVVGCGNEGYVIGTWYDYDQNF